MAKAPVAQAAKPANKTTVTVIYRPRELGDPPFVKWNGIRFDANVPVELNEKDHFVLLPRDRLAPNHQGVLVPQSYEEKVSMIELAKGNPSFEVDGKRARKKTSTRVVPPPGAEWTEANEGVISESDVVDVDATRDFMAA